VGSPAALVAARPDVAAAERQLAARTAFVGAARAGYLPRLTVGGSVGVRASEFDGLGDEEGTRWAVGPVVSWPFLDLGRVRARVDAARGREDEARALYAGTVLRALAEAESALSAYDRARARLAELETAAEASGRAAALAQLRYEEGVTDFLQVLDAQRTLLDAETQLVLGRTDAATALVALYRAVGGGLPADEGEGTPGR
jgi:outer membrane protein TolC